MKSAAPSPSLNSNKARDSREVALSVGPPSFGGRVPLDTRTDVRSVPIPIERPTSPKPEFPVDDHGDNLISIAEPDEFPNEVPRWRHFGSVDIDDEEVGG